MQDGVPHGTSSGYGYHKCRCDVCRAFKSAQSRTHYQANRERRKAQANSYHAANRDEILAKRRADYAANPEQRRADKRAYARAHPAEAVARVREWRKQPHAKVARRLEAHRRRQQKFDKTAREYVSILLNDPCSYCGGPADTVDHIVPVSKGGTSEWQNLTGACRSCNCRKSDRSLLFYLLERSAA